MNKLDHYSNEDIFKLLKEREANWGTTSFSSGVGMGVFIVDYLKLNDEKETLKAQVARLMGVLKRCDCSWTYGCGRDGEFCERCTILKELEEGALKETEPTND